MRQHALLQDRLSETQTTRRPGIEAFNLDRDPRRFEKNFRRVIAPTDQAQHDRICRDRFCHGGADIFTARSFRRRIFFWRRMHRAAAHFRTRSSRWRDRSERAMIRQSEPRGEREKNHQRSNGPLHDETFTHIVELAIRRALYKLAECGAEFIPARTTNRANEKCCGTRDESSGRPPPENSAGVAGAARSAGGLALP